MYLFVTPLHKILKKVQKSDITKSSKMDEMNRLPTKYTLLTIVTSITTIVIILLLGIFVGYIFSSIDIIVNTLCVYYMTSEWKKEYTFCCYKMENTLKACLQSAKSLMAISLETNF